MIKEQTISKEERDAGLRRIVIDWLAESFSTGDYRLLNRGGKTRSRDFYIQIRNRTDADLRELSVQLEIRKDGVPVDTVTARTGASGIRSGEVGQLAFFTREIYFSDFRMLPETVSFKADRMPDRVMQTQEKSRKPSKKKKKNTALTASQAAVDAASLQGSRDECLRRLKRIRERSEDEEISSELDVLIPLLEKLFESADERPGSEQEIRRLIERYLPRMIDPAESYQEYVKKGIGGDEMEDLRSEVRNGIRLVSEACVNLMNRLYEDGIVDASTDISVLEMMLKQDGLLDTEMK